MNKGIVAERGEMNFEWLEEVPVIRGNMAEVARGLKRTRKRQSTEMLIQSPATIVQREASFKNR